MAAAAFLVTWNGFGVVWLLMAHAHQDIGQTGNDTHAPCIDNVYDFRTALLFSIETQTTIGYGYRGLQKHCSEGILLLMLQSCIGVSIQVSDRCAVQPTSTGQDYLFILLTIHAHKKIYVRKNEQL
jgi:hypothetical protein